MATSFRVLLIPGWVCNPRTDGWGPWLIRELEERGAEVVTQPLPHFCGLVPQRRRAVRQFKALLADPSHDTVVLAHSFGAAVATRLLSELHRPIRGAVLVSPLYRWPFKPWVSLWRNPVDPWLVQRNCRRIKIIHSVDDYLVPFQNSVALHHLLDCQMLALDGYGHFAPRDGCFEFPEALQAILDLQRSK